MTLAAVWNHAPGRIHGIADTRISQGAGSVYTDHGPKILPLTVVCRVPGSSGFFDTESFRSEFGFAYAGSTLTALSSLALANIVCGNLAGHPNTPPPFLREVAYRLATISLSYMREIGLTGGFGSIFSAILFGHCPRTNQALAFEISPKVGPNGLELNLHEHPLDDATVVIVGDKPDELRRGIDQIRKEAKHPIVAADAPMRALSALMASGSIESVGGHIQQAWSYSRKLEIVATMTPIEPQPPSTRNAGLFVLGFDIFDMQQIGHFRTTLTGR